jgi:hypothetical protein
MTISMYRGDVFYRQEEIPDPPKDVQSWSMRPHWNIRHMRPLMEIYFNSPLDPMEMMAAIERFVYDPKTSHYVSANFATLPRWVIQQEMEYQEEADRRARFDRVTRMMMERR